MINKRYNKIGEEFGYTLTISIKHNWKMKKISRKYREEDVRENKVLEKRLF